MNHDPCHYLQEEINEKDAELERLKALLTRAADALDDYVGPQGPDNQIDLSGMQLVQELRKAAE